MFPVIAKIGPFTIYGYGLMLALAVVLCTSLLIKDARRVNIPSDTIIDFMFWIIVSGILGARLFYIILNFSYFQQNIVEIIMVQQGGLAWQGGLIGGALFSLWYMKKKKLSLGLTADLFAPYIALGQSVGRIGCFLNGCCYGRESSSGIYFPVHDAHLHPTQLYMSAGLLLIFFALKAYQKRIHQPGQVFWMYVLLASGFRFFIEYARADHFNTLLGLSIYQYVCLSLWAVSIYAFTRLNRRSG